MTTKHQERDALNKIRKIVADLGEDSYIATAFEGCFDLAEQNIEYDAAFSMKYYETQCLELTVDKKRLIELVEKEQDRNAKLLEQLDREQEWKPYESDCNVKQADYVFLANAGGTRMLTDEEAIQLIVDEFGFNRAGITILHSVNLEEANRHHLCRKVGEIDRHPCYNATDWNYIRFDCNNWFYEMHNGSLQQYYC